MRWRRGSGASVANVDNSKRTNEPICFNESAIELDARTHNSFVFVPLICGMCFWSLYSVTRTVHTQFTRIYAATEKCISWFRVHEFVNWIHSERQMPQMFRKVIWIGRLRNRWLMHWMPSICWSWLVWLNWATILTGELMVCEIMIKWYQLMDAIILLNSLRCNVPVQS